MAFRDNSLLIRSSSVVGIGTNDADDVYVATGATTFVFGDGNVGDDSFLGFDSNDAIITRVQIYDRNGDNFISAGPNGIIDIDRTGPGFDGNDHILIAGRNDEITELRYLGTKDGGFAYADGGTLRALWTRFGQENVVEGTVANDRLDMAGGAKILLQDNALGLNLGGDTIANFGSDDLLVTTSALYDGNGDGTIGFARNRVLDMSGVAGPDVADAEAGSGGQLRFTGSSLRSVEYLGSDDIDGVTYYYYGTAGSTFVPGSVDPTA